MNTIGARIRSTREDQGVTRRDLARAAGISYTTLSDLESGKSKTTTVLHKIADHLNVSVKWLETGAGAMENPAQPMRLDGARMNQAIELLRTLGELQGVTELYADGEALTVAYAFLTEIGTQQEKSNVLDLTRKLASRLRGHDGHNGSSKAG